jgi:hypothetical protein
MKAVQKDWILAIWMAAGMLLAGDARLRPVPHPSTEPPTTAGPAERDVAVPEYGSGLRIEIDGGRIHVQRERRCDPVPADSRAACGGRDGQEWADEDEPGCPLA